MNYNYTKFPQISMEIFTEYANLKCEYGEASRVAEALQKAEDALKQCMEQLKSLSGDPQLAEQEPNDYEGIQRLCEGGNLPVKEIADLSDKMAGAMLGRFIACTLGAPVEAESIEMMKLIAKEGGNEFPPTKYWNYVRLPWQVRYLTDRRELYGATKMDGIPVDDDITYTILGLLILERYGFDFTTEDVAEIWQELIPMAYTAEAIALDNLKKGIPASQAADVDNPYCQLIGAMIRPDGFAYACAGDPHKAAWLGYKDAYLSHRRNGIYGEMLFAAAEAAAFTVEDPLDAIRIGLKEIPKESLLYQDVTWALEKAKDIKDYEDARKAVDERFGIMHLAHTNNNACLVVFGLKVGEGDFTKTISQTVAMGLDNDCTAATAGSIIGAIVGAKGIDSYWTEPFHNKARCYLKGYPEFKLDDLVNRFVKMYQNGGK